MLHTAAASPTVTRLHTHMPLNHMFLLTLPHTQVLERLTHHTQGCHSSFAGSCTAMKYVYKLGMGTLVIPAHGRLRQQDLKFLVSLGCNKALCQKGGGSVGKTKDMYTMTNSVLNEYVSQDVPQCIHKPSPTQKHGFSCKGPFIASIRDRFCFLISE